MRRYLAAHVALAVLAIGLAGWAALRWSLIAVGVDGRVQDVGWAEEGPDYRLLVVDGGPTLTLDRGLFDRLARASGRSRPSDGTEGSELVGAHVETRVGSTTARVDGQAVPLRLSATSWRVLALVLVAASTGVVRTRRALRADPPGAADPPPP